MSNPSVPQKLNEVKEVKKFQVGLEDAAILVAEALALIEAGNVSGLVELLDPMIDGRDNIKFDIFNPMNTLCSILEEM